MRPVLPLVLVLLLAGCTGPDTESSIIETAGVSGGSGTTGGVVGNAPPTVPEFASDRTTGDNGGGFQVVFTGAVADANTERHVDRVVVASVPAGVLATRKVHETEVGLADEPADFGADGFKVWGGVPNDGRVHFRYRHTFPIGTPAGAYAVTATAADKVNATGASLPVTVTLTRFSLITVAPAPVGLDGAPLAGQAWGGWNAMPGARDVESVNFVKLVNDGDQPNAAVVIDFTESAFVGAEDPAFSIPLNGNVQFAWWEDATPGVTAPAEGAFTFGPASAEGGTTVTFSGKGNVIYVKYRILSLPSPLPMQAYGASFTVTELA